MFQAAITIITVFVVFQLPCQGPIAWFVILTLFQGMIYSFVYYSNISYLLGLVGMSFGFFLSTICNTSMDAIKMAIGATLAHMLLTGIIWPLEGMPALMVSIIWYLPHTASVQGMRDIMLRGWGLSAPSVWQGLIISSSWTFMFLLLSWALIKNKIH